MKGLTPLKASSDEYEELVAYRFSIDCPQCGRDLVHITSGTSTGLRAGAIAHCLACRLELSIVVSIDAARPIPGKNTRRTQTVAPMTHTNYAKTGRRR